MCAARRAAARSVNVPAISKHISNIYEEGELTREATVSKLETVRTEGEREVTREVDHYNLDMILAVGYRRYHCQSQIEVWRSTSILPEWLPLLGLRNVPSIRRSCWP